MASATVLMAVLLLRILCLLALAASVVLMGLNNFTYNDGRSKAYFTDLVAYRYVIAAGAIGFLYTLIQIPFAIYDAVREKRLIRNGFLQEFDFYGDKVMGFLLASGVGVGFGVSFELKSAFDAVLSDDVKKYLGRGNISTGLLLLAFALMALLCFISSFRHPKQRMFK